MAVALWSFYWVQGASTALAVPCNYKNRLQEFTQKSHIAYPVYLAVNEGLPHHPKFRATVCVDNTSYISPNTFSKLKAAEQDVARVALEGLAEKLPEEEECPVNLENITPFSKSVLNEYATKLSYTGDTARRKKDAEKLAASAAIISMLDGATTGTLYEMVKSKYNFFAEARLNNFDECTHALHSSLATMEKVGDKEVAVPVAVESNETRIALPAPFSKMPEHAPSLKPLSRRFQI
ncbi:double-stranded RNA-binding protein 4-like [Cajanus cajan]|uniref:double-stranded RNA-binding protein 4-like n=1 Tax=Cajanus cajan TaxID=3821 RepID=UPI00098D9ED1|nr:double-stranded RNA-binding protein 4-like [Cajanus cajan]